MDPLSQEALTSFRAAIDALLPDLPEETPEALRPAIAIQPMRISPSGLGGFVAMNEDPEGEILGRRITAAVIVTVRAATVADLHATAAEVSQAVLGAERGELNEQGILDVSLTELGLPRPPRDEGESRTPAEQDVRFRIEYEFLKRPAEAGDVIREIPLDVDLG